jgi:hypothetical protein
VKDLVAGSRIEFEDRGEHDLKAVPGSWKLLAVKGRPARYDQCYVPEDLMRVRRLEARRSEGAPQTPTLTRGSMAAGRPVSRIFPQSERVPVLRLGDVTDRFDPTPSQAHRRSRLGPYRMATRLALAPSVFIGETASAQLRRLQMQGGNHDQFRAIGRVSQSSAFIRA